MQTFDRLEDEARYKEWLAAHPTGYVLNTNQGTANPDATRLHRASCNSISVLQEDKQHFTGGDYQKICSDSREELESWARSAFGWPVTACGQCL